MPNEKQIRFCQEYVIDLNATQAAIRAGYSKKTANRIASRLLSKVDIQTEIAQRQAEIGERLEIDAQRVILELARVAMFDIRRVFDQQGRLRPVHGLDENTARAISSVKVRSETDTPPDGGEPTYVTTTELKVFDKNKALELLAKHFGVISDKIQITNVEEIEQVVLILPDNGRDPHLTAVAIPAEKAPKAGRVESV